MADPESGETVTTDDDVELWMRRIGAGGGGLIVPGAVVDRDLEGLAAPDRLAAFYDTRNRGRSDAVTDPSRLGFQREVDDLDQVRAHLELDRAAALGWSYGAGVVVSWALQHPDRVTGLVLVSPIGPSWHEEAPAPANPAPGALAHLDQLRAAGVPDRDPVSFCEAWRRIYVPLQAGMADVVDRMSSRPCDCPNEWPDNAARAVAHVLVDLGRYDWRDTLGDLDIPVLVVVGDTDPAGVAAGEAWVQGLPDARGVVFPGVGRFPWVEAPERFFREVDVFLRSMG